MFRPILCKAACSRAFSQLTFKAYATTSYRLQSVLPERPFCKMPSVDNSETIGSLRFVWIDCEVRVACIYAKTHGKMTGLNHNKDKIIEIATLITDEHLNPLDPDGFERVIHCSENLLNGMDEWCTTHHENVSFPHFNLFISSQDLPRKFWLPPTPYRRVYGKRIARIYPAVRSS